MKNKYCKCGCGQETPISNRNRYKLGHIKGEHIAYLKGHKRRGIVGPNHFNWKGCNVGYKAFHLRVGNARGKATVCQDCGDQGFVEWANLTGNYGDINDYKSLCRKCHHKLDGHNYKGWHTRRGGVVSA